MQLVYLMYVGPLESGERGGKLELILLLKNKRFWYVRVRRAFQINKKRRHDEGLSSCLLIHRECSSDSAIKALKIIEWKETD